MRKNPSISLSAHHQGLIGRLVESGRYQGASDVVRAALRLLEHHEALREQELQVVLLRANEAVEATLDTESDKGKKGGRKKKRKQARKIPDPNAEGA